jgi:hypothetical protein
MLLAGVIWDSIVQGNKICPEIEGKAIGAADAGWF